MNYHSYCNYFNYINYNNFSILLKEAILIFTRISNFGKYRN